MVTLGEKTRAGFSAKAPLGRDLNDAQCGQYGATVRTLGGSSPGCFWSS